MAVVVCDTSPLRALSHLGLLGILPRLFSDVIIPPTVADELERPRKRFVPVPVSSVPLAHIVAPADVDAVTTLLDAVDLGEAEAIVVALALRADRLLIDESRGRAEARARGLRPLGVLGVLVRAKRLRLIDGVEPRVDRLQRELGFFVSATVRSRILKQAKEA